MDSCDEVADTFSDCQGCTDHFSSRLGSLNLSCSSISFDPAFTFDASSRASSLQPSDSISSRSAALVDHMPPARLSLLAAVEPSPVASSRRHLAAVRRVGLPTSPSLSLQARLSTSGDQFTSSEAARSFVPTPATEPYARIPASILPACGGGGGGGSQLEYFGAAGPLTGAKRRCCPEPSAAEAAAATDTPPHQRETPAATIALADGIMPLQPEAPSQSAPSTSTSFASFAAALAAHYFADFGIVPDVPKHMEELRRRESKRQRLLPVGQVADV